MDPVSDSHNISKAVSEGLTRLNKVIYDGMFDLDTMLVRLEKEVGPMRISLRVISDSMPGWLSYLIFFLIFVALWSVSRRLNEISQHLKTIAGAKPPSQPE